MNSTSNFSKLRSQRSTLVNWLRVRMWTKWRRIFKRSLTSLVSRFWNMTSHTSREKRLCMATLSIVLTCSSWFKRSQWWSIPRAGPQFQHQTSPIRMVLLTTSNSLNSKTMMAASMMAWRMMRRSWSLTPVTQAENSRWEEEGPTLIIITALPTTNSSKWGMMRTLSLRSRMRKSSTRRS